MKKLSPHLSQIFQKLPERANGISLKYKTQKFLEGLNYSPEYSHFFWRSIFTEEEKRQLHSLLGETPESFSRVSHLFNNKIDSMESFATFDIETWLQKMALYQGDMLSMINGVELRAPMMDHHFVEFAMNLQRNKKFSPRKTKPLLRKLAKRSLPHHVLNLKKKGLHIPFNEWFMGDLNSFMKEKLSKERLEYCGVSHNFVKKLIHDHMSFHKDNSYHIINLMIFVEWYISHFSELKAETSYGQS